MNQCQQNLRDIPAQADCLFTQQEVELALDKLAQDITRDFTDKYPLIIGVMNGALPTLGYLLPRLPFLLEVDYLHATRYQGQTQGGEIIWKRRPVISMQDRHVLLVDDILDRGITLAAIAHYCLEAGALDVKIAVLTEKKINGFTASVAANYVALFVPDRYVFGYGMDYENHWRNAPGIFALKNKGIIKV